MEDASTAGAKDRGAVEARPAFVDAGSLSLGVDPQAPHSLEEPGALDHLWDALQRTRDSQAKMWDPDDPPRDISFTGWPEIGTIVTLRKGAFCTATKVGRRAILAAAHCFDCQDSDDLVGTWFAVYDPDGTITLYRLQRVRNLYRQQCSNAPPPPARDIAIAIVRDDAVRTPLPATFRRIRLGAIDDRVVTIVGAGCVQPHADRGRGVRRRLTGPWSRFRDAHIVCAGDSGGPVIESQSNDIVGLVTGYYTDSGRGAFALMSPDTIAWIRARQVELDP